MGTTSVACWACREHPQRRQHEFGFRVEVVRYFHEFRQQGVPERRAIEFVLDKYRPRKKGDLRLSASTIRNWVRQVKQAHGDCRVLRPQSRRPQQITFRVPDKLGSNCTSHSGSSACLTRAWQARSRIVGIPKGRFSVLPGLGM